MADSKMYKEKAEKKVGARHIKDELLELKQKIETVRDKLKNKAVRKPKSAIDRQLMEVSIRLESLVKKHLKDVQ